MHALSIRRFGSIVGAVALCGMLASCSSDAAIGTDASIVGSYTLRTVDGIPLPAADLSGEVYFASTLIFRTDQEFDYSTTVQLPHQGQSTSAGSGSYSLNGSVVTILQQDGVTGTLQFSGGNTLTLSNGAEAYVYRK